MAKAVADPRSPMRVKRRGRSHAGANETAANRPSDSFRAEAPHRIVVVGGGTAGLELVTRLGDRLGRRRRAGSRWWKRPGPSLETVAA